MALADLLAEAGGGQGFDALARRFGVTPEQARSVAAATLPAMSSGLGRMTRSPDGLAQLAAMLRANDAAPAHEAPEAHASVADAQGARLLEQIFGSAGPRVQGALAEEASGRTGLGSGAIAAMLPAILAMVMGGLQKRETSDAGLGGLVKGLLEGAGGGGSDSAGGGGLGGMIEGMVKSVGGAQSAGMAPSGGGGAGAGGLGEVLGGLFGGAKAAPQVGAAAPGGLDLSVLTRMFDADGDGSIADDLLERLTKG